MKEYLEAIQILHPDIVKFLTFNAHKIEKQWRQDMYLFKKDTRYLDIVNYVMYSDRIQNLMVNGRVKKTDLLMAFRSDMGMSEQKARNIMQGAIDDGKLTEEQENKIKWISV